MNNIKTEFKWAMIFVVVSLLWMLLEKLTGLHSTHIDMHFYLTNLFAIPAILVFVLALKDKKKNDLGGQMSFKQGFISGAIITLIVTLLAPLTQWITSTYITPEYFPNVIEHSLSTGFHATRDEAEAYFNLSNYMVQSTIGALVMGLITSAIVALILRSKAKA